MSGATVADRRTGVAVAPHEVNGFMAVWLIVLAAVALLVFVVSRVIDRETRRRLRLLGAVLFAAMVLLFLLAYLVTKTG